MKQPHPKKEGRLCCFILCDMRRAVIIINTISIVANFLALMILLTGINPVFDDAKDDLADKYGADNTLTVDQSDELDTLQRNLAILTGVGFAVSVGAICGAIKYKWHPVALQAVFVVASLIVTITLNKAAADDVETYSYGLENFVSYIVGTGVAVYVHVSLVKEIRNGIMTPETYANREAFSLCCMPGGHDPDDVAPDAEVVAPDVAVKTDIEM